MALMATLQASSAGERATAMVDLAFAIDGERLPRAYAYPLAEALVATLPWMAGDPTIGVHPVRAPLTDYGLVLSRRARLVLRIPAARAGAARSLSGQTLELGDATVRLGAATERPLAAFATLKAWNVASTATDEAGFIEDVMFQLEALGIDAKLICGRPAGVDTGSTEVRGYGLALHELSVRDSLRLQTLGLGPARRLGCGLFVPHKIIEGLDAMPE